MDAIEIVPVSNGFIVRDMFGLDGRDMGRCASVSRIVVCKTPEELGAFVAAFYAGRTYTEWVATKAAA